MQVLPIVHDPTILGIIKNDEGVTHVQSVALKGGLLVYVPKENANSLLEKLYDAGAGAMGNYDQCSFVTSSKLITAVSILIPVVVAVLFTVKAILNYYLDFTWYFGNLLFPIFLFLAVIWFTSKLANNTEASYVYMVDP